MCNVVLTDRRPPVLKLCDFGFAKGWEDDSQMHTRIGTPVYMSPQVGKGVRGREVRGTLANDRVDRTRRVGLASLGHGPWVPSTPWPP